MICRYCNEKLMVQNSRPSDNYTTLREYFCIFCKKVYISIEQLDTEPLDREAQKAKFELFKKQRGERKNV